MHTTDAHALQAILQRMNDHANGGTIQARWETVLNTSGRGVEFSARHGEVVSLLNETIRHVQSLPDSKRANYEPYLVYWWTAVMCPDVQWGAGHQQGVITAEHVALLGSLGDVIEARLEHTSAAPGGFRLEAVREQCEGWIEHINGASLPTNYETLLIKQLEHLLWLIDHAETFGVSRVASAAEDITGHLVMASLRVPEAERHSWTRRMREWTGMLVTFTALTMAGHTAIEGATTLINDIAPGVEYVLDAVEPDDSPAP